MFSYSLKGKPCFSFLVAPVSDGFMITFTRPNIGDIHLTILNKEERVFWHITDKSDPLESSKTKVCPFGHHMPEEIFNEKMSKLTKKMFRGYSCHEKAWIMTNVLKSIIEEYRTQLDPDPGQFPLELFRTGIICDFKNKERWQEIRIKDLLDKPNELALLSEKGTLKFVQPINSDKMMCYSIKQIEKLASFIYKSLGIDDYIEYVARKKGSDFISRSA